MCRGDEDYARKEILILGGGDAALLHELQKENPKFVTMIEVLHKLHVVKDVLPWDGIMGYYCPTSFPYVVCRWTSW
jgi:hypothetical protein